MKIDNNSLILCPYKNTPNISCFSFVNTFCKFFFRFHSFLCSLQADMNRFRQNLVKITNIFALLHRPHLHFTQVLNSCSCILPAAGRRPPGGSGELRSPSAVLPHRRACGRPPAPCTTRKRATAPTPLLPPRLPCRCLLRPAGTGGALPL